MLYQPLHHTSGTSFLPVLLGLVVVMAMIVAAVWGGENGYGGSAGRGAVVGIVGRMGSGKSYGAVRMALSRLMKGANVVTNFTMKFETLCERRGCVHEGPPCVAWDLRRRWRLFTGWDQFAELEDAVVILDEAHLYAPSNKTISFPDLARWKLSMGRKFGLDLYWITQHENRVNSVLRDLTNEIWVCNAWVGGHFFVMRAYEPEAVRKKGKQIDRRVYRFKWRVANLYDSFQIIQSDNKHFDDFRRITALAEERNRKRVYGYDGGPPEERNEAAGK